MVATDNAICVPGNHDYKLLRHLKGQKVTINHGLDKTLAELEPLADTELLSLKTFLHDIVHARCKGVVDDVAFVLLGDRPHGWRVMSHHHRCTVEILAAL